MPKSVSRLGGRRVSKALVSGALLVIVIAPTIAAAAETVHLYRPIPPEAARLHDRLSPMLAPPVRAWVDEQARRLAAGSMAVESLDPAARSRFMAAGRMGPGGIEAVAFIVMSQATKDMDKDLKKIMAEVKAQQEAREKLGDLLSRVGKDIAGNTGRKDDDRCVAPVCGGYARDLAAVSSELARLSPGRRTVFREPKTVKDLSPLRDALKSRLEGMAKESEMASLRLHEMMNRRDALINALSNLINKAHSTADNVVRNLK